MLKKNITAAVLAALATSPVYAENWYLRGFGGYSKLDSFDFNTALGEVESKTDGGFNVGAAAGVDSNWIRHITPSEVFGSRFEMEYAYREDSIDTHRLGGARLPASSGDFGAHSLMANALIDFNQQSPLSFYGGGGIGVAFVNYDSFRAAGNNVFDDDDTVFAFQGIAGAEYKIDPRWSLFAEYRYFGTLDPDVTLFPGVGGARRSVDLDTHNVGGGIRYRF